MFAIVKEKQTLSEEKSEGKGIVCALTKGDQQA
jgi:hypothetical protein